MYFAVESHDPASWLDGLLQTVLGAPQVHWFALVDGAFDLGGKPFVPPGPYVPLYGRSSALYDLLPAPPYLVPLDHRTGADLRAMVTALGTHCQGRPMLSFLASWKPADELVHLWQPCLQPVVAAEGARHLLRFADTRVLSALPGALDPAAWARLTAPLMHWCYVGRAGTLEPLWLAEPRAEPPTYSTQPLVLSQSDVDRLVEAALPDAILDLIERQAPGSLPEIGRATAYRLVARARALARAHRVEAAPDIVLLASHALATGGAGLQAPELLAVLGEPQRSPGALRAYLLSARGMDARRAG
ncbi:DUF4123 domain-containing protein [Ralstonia solanacearum]|uniref:DUF4123 domain-containing protein n=1 Tax=Ralstonia solanacearum (strain Po82) TaxID=1031711 RepID=F6G6U3_RALS8|nr:DUF4123 domain-containing protein [Ralstonia solanacearum]AEG67638.1 conserved hypothetical protein [Ralstonia solanacearum Po82]AMP74085.1 hypothetical protein RALBFv3_07895 [Ralstonia solanacearum]AYB59379.1 DUF4123 domain-containing protein [Ralstonia solanacearum]MBB6586144.1 DUF4123 domain-containing protein [Ralstonia solanacearum]MCG3576687.1 DUF4123 domain-containing protein [Ralstonia solanacearum]